VAKSVPQHHPHQSLSECCAVFFLNVLNAAVGCHAFGTYHVHCVAIATGQISSLVTINMQGIKRHRDWESVQNLAGGSINPIE
jgi:hypothetical protein